VGNQTLQETYIDVDFHRRIEVNKITNKRILGLPVEFVDKKLEWIKYNKPTHNYDLIN
jgi:hypothetical protein